jgi:hypothetical protein
MATAITFGLILGTFLILFLIPIFYMIYGNLFGVAHSNSSSAESAVTDTE